MRISDWSSDVCSSDLHLRDLDIGIGEARRLEHPGIIGRQFGHLAAPLDGRDRDAVDQDLLRHRRIGGPGVGGRRGEQRSEEHTSELQSLMRISYAVFCLKKKIDKRTT